jgi:Ribbon-helix-helix protein, copG family
MAKKNCLTALRLDANSIAILKDLSCDLNSSKSQLMRQAIRLMKQLNEIQRQHGELRLITATGEKFLILIS